MDLLHERVLVVGTKDVVPMLELLQRGVELAACNAAGSATDKKALSCLRKPIPARFNSCSMNEWPFK